MALNGNILGDAVVTNLLAAGYGDNAGGEMTDIWRVVGNAIVDHFVANGTVPFPIAVTVDPGTHVGGTTANGTIL